MIDRIRCSTIDIIVFSVQEKMAHSNLKNEDPALYKRTTKDDETKELKYKTEKTITKLYLNHPKLLMVTIGRSRKV